MLMLGCKGTIKSAITTLNIAIVTLALYPVYDILLVIKVSDPLLWSRVWYI
jgi:hypothetical protein